MVGWHHQLHGHEFEQGPGDGEGQRSLVCCSPGGRKESDTTERLNSNNNINKMSSARKNGHQNFIIVVNYALLGFPGGSDRKESACDAGDPGLIPGLGRFSRRREWQLTPIFLPGESHGQKSLAGYNPWGRKEVDVTKAT